MSPEIKASVIATIVVFIIIVAIAKLFDIVFSRRYYCTSCGSANVRKKTKSNYGCVMSGLDLMFFIGAFFTLGLTLIGCLLIHCCVRKTKICRECGCENCLIPMRSPAAKKALSNSKS